VRGSCSGAGPSTEFNTGIFEIKFPKDKISGTEKRRCKFFQRTIKKFEP
jgi:hypothetical protein